MIDKYTFLRVKDWFIVCLQLNRDELAFEYDLVSHKFKFHQDLIDFLDVINGGQFVRCKRFGPSVRDEWESNALNSILEEAKKFEILKNVRCDTSEKYRYELVQELIKKMKIWHPYCMIVCNFLANSKPTNTPEKYTNLRILCKYWIDCQRALENNCRFEFQLSAQFI